MTNKKKETASKLNKSLFFIKGVQNKPHFKQLFIFIFFIVIMGTYVLASTVISDTSITTPKINSVVYVEAGNAADIQTKLDSCTDCMIRIPKGIYEIDVPLNFSAGQSIIGDGPNSTIITPSGSWSGDYMIGPETPNAEQEYVRIQGMKFDCDGGVNDGVLFNNTKRSIIEDVWAKKCIVNNFHIGDNSYTARLEKIRSSSSDGNGILIEDNEVTISNAKIGDAIGINITQKPGLSVSGIINNVAIINSHIEGGTTIGVWINNADDVDLKNNRYEGYPDCVTVTSEASAIRIFGGRFDGCSGNNLVDGTDREVLWQRDNKFDAMFIQNDLVFIGDSGANIEHNREIDLFPWGQVSKGLRITNDTDVVIEANGDGTLRINDIVWIGDGVSQSNLVMTSPDGTEYTCVVADGGAFSCS